MITSPYGKVIKIPNYKFLDQSMKRFINQTNDWLLRKPISLHKKSIKKSDVVTPYLAPVPVRVREVQLPEITVIDLLKSTCFGQTFLCGDKKIRLTNTGVRVAVEDAEDSKRFFLYRDLIETADFLPGGSRIPEVERLHKYLRDLYFKELKNLAINIPKSYEELMSLAPGTLVCFKGVNEVYLEIVGHAKNKALRLLQVVSGDIGIKRRIEIRLRRLSSGFTEGYTAAELRLHQYVMGMLYTNV